MKTLVITSHLYPDQSRVIKALQDTAGGLPEVTVRNLESIYGQRLSGFDLAAEQQAHEAVDRIVFLFPIHWFNRTPMKATALYVGMNYLLPLVFHEAIGAAPERIEGFQQALAQRLAA